jgi:hypothetical protein
MPRRSTTHEPRTGVVRGCTVICMCDSSVNESR